MSNESRKIELLVLFTLLFILIRTMIGFLMQIPTIQENPAPPSTEEIIRGVVGGVLAAIIIAPAFSWILQRGFFKSKHQIKIGSKIIEINLDDVDETVDLLQEKVKDLQEYPQVYIAYASQDGDFAKRLIGDLKSQAIDVFSQEVWGTSEIIDIVGREISERQWFLVISSISASESKKVSGELGIALQSEKKRGREFVIPLLRNGEKPRPELGKRKFIDFRDDNDYKIALDNLTKKIIPKIDRSNKETEELPLLLQDILIDWNQDGMSNSEFEERRQVLSLFKWLREDNVTGWYELWEVVQYGEGLTPRVRAMLEQELLQIKQDKPFDGNLKERIASLLNVNRASE